MTSEDWNLVSYEEAESVEQVTLSPEFAAAVAVDALHDSSPVATCIPGTHTTAKDRLSICLAGHSARNPQRRFNILWAHGPAGVGKTTLMKTLANALLPPESSSSIVTVSPEGDTRPEHPPSYEADEFRTAGIQYGGAALFFSKDHHITDASKFFMTLAYGLARRLPPLAGFIQSAFDFTKQSQPLSAREQAKALILDPLKGWVFSEDGDVDVDLVIIVDGLDTFENKNAQTEVVEIVREVFTQRVDGVRWLWVFSSRTEARLHEVFLGPDPSVSPKAEEILIGLANEAEMKAYLEGATAQIRQTHPAFQNPPGVVARPGAEREEEEWPSSQDITTLQWQAGGLYAAASSMISYIGNPTSDPRIRISLIEDPACVDGSDSPYAKLDTMYKDILASVALDTRSTTKRVLGAISCMQPSSHDQQPPTLTLLSDILDIEGVEILKLLYDLHSLVNAPMKPVKSLRGRNLLRDHFHLGFHHRSFDQFLRTPARSLDWSLDLEATHMDLARCSLKKLSPGGFTSGSNTWRYAKQRWYVHCWRTGKDTEAALGILPDLFEFDYSVLGDISAVVDRYFIEWLLHLQETTMSEWQILNPGPFVEPTADPITDSNELDLNPLSPGFRVAEGSRGSSSNPTPRGTGKRLPARKSYIIGLEPAKQVYLVPYYDVKVQWRADLGQQLGPREKHWDWIRGFRIVSHDYVDANVDGDEEEDRDRGEEDENTAGARRAQDNESGSSKKGNDTADEDEELYA